MTLSEEYLYSLPGGEKPLAGFVEHLYGFMEILSEVSPVGISKAGIELNRRASV